MMKNSISKHTIFWMVSLFLFAILYFFNLDGWLMHDDEGTDFYEVWQLQEGQKPGVDYIAEQQPLFLLAGSAIVGWAGRNPLPLRFLASIQVLVGTFFLAMSIRYIWGDPTAILTMILLLTSGLVYEQARLFRPDPMMLAWEMAGLAAVIMGLYKQRRYWWVLAGICYGMGILWKLFGIFPVIGLVLFFLFRMWRERTQWRQVILDGFAFAIPFLLVCGLSSLLLYSHLGFYYLEPFQYHLEMGQDSSIPFRSVLQLVIMLFFFLIWSNSLFLLIGPLWYLNKDHAWHSNTNIIYMLISQLISPIVFVFVSRTLHLRYFLYLTPTLAILLALQIQISMTKIQTPKISQRFIAVICIISLIIAAILTTRPKVNELLLRQETGTHSLADLVAEHTIPGQVVISDYAGVNFFADRPSIYEASIIAGGQILSGAVTGELLIDRIETKDVRMVLIHVEGGDPFPHQLVNLIDYDDFRAYVIENFELITVFDRNEQLIEVYKKRPLSHDP